MIILIVAAVIAALLGEYVDALAIMCIVILNAIIGVVQESKAEQALAALKKMAAPNAQVIRDGQQLTVPARELVPGDIVLLEAGNYVPADLRLVTSVNLKIEEASLTGESVPVEKQAALVLDGDAPLGDRRNCAFLSTLITYGRGKGIVTGTGMHTQIGLIAEMIQSYEEEDTPLQKKLRAPRKGARNRLHRDLRGRSLLRPVPGYAPDGRARHRLSQLLGGREERHRQSLPDRRQPRHCRRSGGASRDRDDLSAPWACSG